MYLSKTPSIVKPLAKDFLWRVDTTSKELYLTFDDGPTPGVTDIVLDLLKQFDAKGTFFCVGKNIQMHTDLYQRLIDEGHSIGNHSFDHQNGWKTNNLSLIHI